MKPLFVVLGVVCGAWVGLVTGCGISLGLVWLLYAMATSNSADPSAGAVSIVGALTGLITIPAGGILGAVAGGICAANRPRLFLALILPTAILFAVMATTLQTLRNWDQPRVYVVRLDGTPGTSVAGRIMIDGINQPFRGDVPMEWRGVGTQIQFEAALQDPDDERAIAVHIAANGKDLKTGIKTTRGCRLQLTSRGYNETFGRSSYGWQNLLFNDDAEEVLRNWGNADNR